MIDRKGCQGGASGARVPKFEELAYLLGIDDFALSGPANGMAHVPLLCYSSI